MFYFITLSINKKFVYIFLFFFTEIVASLRSATIITWGVLLVVVPSILRASLQSHLSKWPSDHQLRHSALWTRLCWHKEPTPCRHACQRCQRIRLSWYSRVWLSRPRRLRSAAFRCLRSGPWVSKCCDLQMSSIETNKRKVST